MIFFRIALLLLLSSILPAFTQEFSMSNNSRWDRAEAIKDIRVETLSNGMKIAIKPLRDSLEDVHFRLLAPGGYNSFSNEAKVSARLSPQIAWESGLGDKSVDQVSALMYTEAIELSVKINPFSREIIGSCHKDSVDACLKLIHSLFSETKISPEAVRVVIEKTENVLRSRPQDRDLTYEDIHFAINTNHHRFFRPFSIKSLRKVEAPIVEDIYNEAFGDPSQYVAVIVGDVDVKKVVEAANARLGTIQKRGSGKHVFSAPKNLPPFPEVPVRKSVADMHKRSDGISIDYTFPVLTKGIVSLDEYKLLNFCCQILERKIRQQFFERKEKAFGVDVAYEIPYYPYLDKVWLSIQYRTDNTYQEKTEKDIFTILEHLRTHGPTFEEMEYIKGFLASADEFWTKEYSFWLNNLTNYLLWGWDLQEVLHEFKEEGSPTRQEIQQFLKERISLNRYTRLIALP